jgi:hypothetical protein
MLRGLGAAKLPPSLSVRFTPSLLSPDFYALGRPVYYFVTVLFRRAIGFGF